MIPYWLLFFLPALAVMVHSEELQRKPTVGVIAFAVFATLMIGLRIYVGGDWSHYLSKFHMLHYLSLSDGLSYTDMGYAILNWSMGDFEWGIYGVNLVCGGIFMAGLAAFSLRMPNPWMAMMVAMPYLLVVVAMGYTRQSVALGFEFLALNALARKETWRFYAWIICAALFHKTAIVLTLLGIFSGSNRFSLLRVCLGLIVVYLSLNAFVADHYENLVKNYIDAQMESSGALIRVMMNVLPAVIFLLFYRRWRQQVAVNSSWLLFALAALACIPMLAVASTAVDRMALYLAPLQLYVWSHLSIIMNKPSLRIVIVLYHAAVLFVWLNFATHANFWLPYYNVIFQ